MSTVQPHTPSSSQVRNFLTFDIEDWFQSTWDLNRPVSDRAVTNTNLLLEILNDYPVKATFFVQGMIAEKFPDLIQRISSHGHEIASHGFSHRPVNKMSKDLFREEVIRSKKLLEDITQKSVVGFRAPDFSIDSESFWAFDVLRESGIRYDSSIFPKKMRRYGIENFQKDSSVMHPSGIKEIPMSVWESALGELPIAGGGYLRLYPYALTKYAVRSLNARYQRPAMIYMHPYELNPRDFAGEKIPFPVKVHQGLFRGRMEKRLRRLLTDFKFMTCKEFVENEQNWR